MAAKDSYINAEQKQELEESTTCCICTEIYKYPKLLPCFHTFCMNCIQETGLEQGKTPGDEMPCPMCRRQFKIPSDGFTGLQNNYYAEGLIRVAQILDPSMAASIACDTCLKENQKEAGEEVPRADMYCCDCKQKLCEECCRHHGRFTKNHRIISINGQRPTDEDLIQILMTKVCDLHTQEDLKIYCCDCKTCACDICFTEHHERHKGTHITKAVDEFRKDIENKIEKVETCISQAHIKKSGITMWREDADEKLVSLECDIVRRRDCLKQVIDKHAKELLEELSSKRQSIMKEAKLETDNIDAQLARLESYNSYSRKIMTNGSAFVICLSAGDLSATTNALQGENQSVTEIEL